MKVKELRNLNTRKWDDDTKIYESLYIINSGKKHDSGWALIMIIGLIGNKKEIAATCDDICWKIPEKCYYDLRTDMEYPNGIIHFWSNKYKFRVGSSLSSTDIFLVK